LEVRKTFQTFAHRKMAKVIDGVIKKRENTSPVGLRVGRKKE
jgi:hypothetical protein